MVWRANGFARGPLGAGSYRIDAGDGILVCGGERGRWGGEADEGGVTEELRRSHLPDGASSGINPPFVSP